MSPHDTDPTSLALAAAAAEDAAAPEPDTRIVYVDVDDLPPADRNPKAHRLDLIRESMARFGFTVPVLIDERTGDLAAGHGRKEALTGMRDAGQPAPEGIQTTPEGTWLVPVIHGSWTSRTDAEAEAFLIADNHLSEIGGWDQSGLIGLLEDTTADLLALTGFTADDLAALTAGTEGPGRPVSHNAETPAEGRELEGDADDAPEIAETPSIARDGDVWHLGPHRLVVGDCTDPQVLAALLGDERPDMMWTDPPYGIDYVGKTPEAKTIRGDSPGGLPALLDATFKALTPFLRPGAPVYMAHPASPIQRVFVERFIAAGWSLRQQLLWVKDRFVLGNSDYHGRHEPILYGFTPVPEGSGRLGRGGPHWFGDHSQQTVFRIPRPARSEDHPTMKPVDLVAAMLGNSCPPRGTVLDPFAGSGTTMLAAHVYGAAARLVEVDPRYADVICRRYESLTGDTPVRDGQAVTFLDAAAEPVDQGDEDPLEQPATDALAAVVAED